MNKTKTQQRYTFFLKNKNNIVFFANIYIFCKFVALFLILTED